VACFAPGTSWRRRGAGFRRGRFVNAAREQSHAIELALAGFAHDIRTPLTGILALSQLLQASDLPKRERSWAEAIRGAADHLARLTTLVADAAKADATGLVLRDEPFSPQELAHSVARSLAARGQAKVLDVNIDIAKRLPGRVSGDEVRLRRALEVKFTERGGIGFAVSSAALGSGRVRLTFAVTDSGMGIAAADLKRLFRPFAQASEEVARRYGGVGLGFVLVKRIAKAMGGDLVVASKPGRGSTFRLTVVVRSAASPFAGV
jgi:signal transduction histidine kinase